MSRQKGESTLEDSRAVDATQATIARDSTGLRLGSRLLVRAAKSPHTDGDAINKIPGGVL